VAGAIKATHPDFRYQPIVPAEESGHGGRIPWVSGRPGEVPAYAGTDFIIARDGRIAAVYATELQRRGTLTQNGLRGRVASIDLWVSLVLLVNPSELSSTIEATSSRPFEE
jgi:hypothetical protein